MPPATHILQIEKAAIQEGGTEGRLLQFLAVEDGRLAHTSGFAEQTTRARPVVDASDLKIEGDRLAETCTGAYGTAWSQTMELPPLEWAVPCPVLPLPETVPAAKLLAEGRGTSGKRDRFMHADTMRRLDRWIGVPTCAALTLFERLRRCVRRPPGGQVRRLLVVKLAEQGATVLAWRALARAAEVVGRENLYVLVFEPNRFVLDVLDVVPPENVLTVPTEGFARFTGGMLRALGRIRRLGIDAVVDFEFFARASAVVSYLAGAPRRVGLDSRASGGPYRGDLLTHRLVHNPQVHASRLFETMIEAVWADASILPALDRDAPDPPGPPSPFVPTEAERETVRAVVAEMAATEDFRPLVLLNANASDLMPLRRWPEERYVALAKAVLAARADVRIAFTGSPAQATEAESLAAAVDSPRCFSLAGRTTLRELLVLYGEAAVLVTNDSGPGQFIALTPVRAVVLFGPETPRVFGPLSPHATVLYKGIPCSPCVSAYNNRDSICRNNVCMQRISVEEVRETVLGLLDDPDGRPR